MAFLDFTKIPQKEIIPGYKAQITHTENLTIVYWTIQKGYPIPEHKHINEQVTTMLNGIFEITINGETKQLKPGDISTIPSNISHSGKAITDCNLVDIFYPIREDYK